MEVEEIARIFKKNNLKIKRKGYANIIDHNFPMVDVIVETCKEENLACDLARAIKLVFPVCFQVEGWKRDDNGRINGVRIYFFDDNLEKEIEPYRQLKHNYV